MSNKEYIGFIGQGWIGKNYANDFENRGYQVVRHSLEQDRSKEIKECGITFIAVPTPSIKEKFDLSVVREVLHLIGKGNVAVIKSTLIPGSTERLQREFPDIVIMHSPEFLTEATAEYDASHPDRNIIGCKEEDRELAQEVLSIMAHAKYYAICSPREAELVKYASNCFFYTKVMFMNILYDLAERNGINWELFRDMMIADPRVGEMHTTPVHKGGRGGGGHCFIKDFSAFIELYKRDIGEDEGFNILKANEALNLKLLRKTGKSKDIVKQVYGE